MRILVVGAGATGGFYGGKLTLAGRDVTFLLREGKARQIADNGLRILTHTGEPLTVHPPIVSADELHHAPDIYDLIVISTKAYQLEGAMDDIAPAVGPETMLLPILNGMRQLSLLEQRFGREHVLGGSVRIVSDMDEQGRVVQMTSLEELSYGELSGERTARIEAVNQVMQGAGFTALLQDDIFANLWQKWWILAGMGTICVLARGTTGQAAEAPYGPALARMVLQECTSIAAANGYSPNPAMLAQHVERYTEVGSKLTSSLYRDMLKGAPVEADHIFGDLLARANGVSVPLLTAAYVQLKVYEAARAS